MNRNPLHLIVAFAITPLGFRVVLEGGHVIEYSREQKERPSLPPPTFITTAEPVPEPSRPGLVKAVRSNVIPLKRVG